jgi:hypothetical protein
MEAFRFYVGKEGGNEKIMNTWKGFMMRGVGFYGSGNIPATAQLVLSVSSKTIWMVSAFFPRILTISAVIASASSFFCS